MEIEFWQERWENDQTGFHQDQVNPYLAWFYGKNGPDKEKRESLKVFVPLCGKSRDMVWLAQNSYEVFGVECSDKAVNAFFNENAISYRHASNDDSALYQSTETGIRPLEIYRGDFFSLQAEHLQGVTDVFDRAALIALPGDMRRAYADKMAALLPAGTRVLLVTLSYDQSEMAGPPFSVDEDNVTALFSEHFEVNKLLYKNIIDDEPRFRERGMSSLVETVYKLVRK